MVILGIVLLIVGIVLLLAPIPFANVDAVGWLLVLVGVVLLIVGLLIGSGLDLGDDRAALPFRSSWSCLLAGPWLVRGRRRLLS